MRIEYIKSVNKGNPFIRIASDTASDFDDLHVLLRRAIDQGESFSTASSPLSSGCSIDFLVKGNESVIYPVDQISYIYSLSNSAMSDLCDGLIQLSSSIGYKWFYTKSGINLLVCRYEHGFT